MAGTLALTRRTNEEVVIGPAGPDQIVVRVASIRGEKVRLAITAPVSVGVHRREVFERIKHEGQRTTTFARSTDGLGGTDAPASPIAELKDDGGRDLAV